MTGQQDEWHRPLRHVGAGELSENTGQTPGMTRHEAISSRTVGSERLWMMRPSCSVIEQNVQPPKQPRMMLTEKRIISQAGMRALP